MYNIRFVTINIKLMIKLYFVMQVIHL